MQLTVVERVSADVLVLEHITKLATYGNGVS
jgi:hypothetical protein